MDQPPSSSDRRSLKRKLEPQKSHQDFLSEVVSQVTIINSSLSSSQSDPLAAKRAVFVLCELLKNEVIANSVVPVLLKHVKAPGPVSGRDGVPKLNEHEVEEGCILVLELLADKPEHKQLIVDVGALPYLTDLLKRNKTCDNSPAITGLIKRAVNVIRNLAFKSSSIKACIRIEGGIPPLVHLLEFNDAEVQGAAARALRSLAYKNDENKKQIVRCNALPTLVLMIGSKDAAIQSEAVGVIENLVESSPNIKRKVLLAGALQPVIGLLRSCSWESQRGAAHLIGLFALTDYDCQVHIAQRGAIQPLIHMLKSPNARLQELSSLALGRLAQNTHNQADIAYNGGINPLLDLLCSKNRSIHYNAAFALYGLADNKDNVVDIVKVGGVIRLLDEGFIIRPAEEEYVGKIMKRLKNKMHGQVLKQLLYLLRIGEKSVQRHVALTFAHLCAPSDGKFIFVDNNGLKVLMDLLEFANLKEKREASMALYYLAVRTTSIFSFDTAPPCQGQLGEFGGQLVNNPKFSDVTFLVEGKRFYAHRTCFFAASDVFHAMFYGHYREREAKDIEIPNIRWDVFESMMRFIYTGTVDVNFDVAQDLLRAADQYLLDGLKRHCECIIAQGISVENVSLMYDLSESSRAMSLRQSCILFLLAQFDKLSGKPWYRGLMRRIFPDIHEFLRSLLTKPAQAKS